MNGNLKKYIYIIGTVCLAFFAIRMFVKILPGILLIGIVVYIITKIVRFIKGKSPQKDPSKFDDSKDNEYSYNVPGDEYTNGEVIDVEYEDIDDNKD